MSPDWQHAKVAQTHEMPVEARTHELGPARRHELGSQSVHELN